MTKPSTAKTVTVHVPMTFALHGGRKTVIFEIVPTAPPPQRTGDALLKALAKAFRWRKQIENGEYASIAELARAQNVNESYACRVLRLTMLSPQLVIAALDGRQPGDLTLNQLVKPLPARWDQQIAFLESRVVKHTRPRKVG